MYHSVRLDIPENLHLCLTFSYSSLPDWASHLSRFSTDSESPFLCWSITASVSKTTQLHALRHRRQHARTLSVRYFDPHISSPYNRPRTPRGKVEVLLCSFYNLGARRGWVVNATPRPLHPRKRPGTHCVGGWVFPRAGLDGRGKSRPQQDAIPGPSSPYGVAIPTPLSRPTLWPPTS
jgi:hypothetical protein